jgi:uncharacterized membrane protein YphA (DoxX/SURF4 family)
MFTTACVVSALLAVLLLFSAVGKLRGDQMQTQTLEKVGFPASGVWLLAVAEVAAAIGMVIGLFWWPLGVAAAVGAILYFLGATVSHLRVRDYNVTAPVVLLLVAAVVAVLRTLSA